MALYTLFAPLHLEVFSTFLHFVLDFRHMCSLRENKEEETRIEKMQGEGRLCIRMCIFIMAYWIELRLESV